MSNPTNIFDLLTEDLATFLAKAVSDGTYSDVVDTLKVDDTGLETPATGITTAEGQLWSNLLDDWLKTAYPIARLIALGGVAGQVLTGNGAGILPSFQPAGTAAMGVTEFRYLAFDHNDFDGAVTNIGAALPAGAIVIRARIAVLTIFDGTVMTMGVGVSDSSIMDSSLSDASTADVYTKDLQSLRSGDQLTFTADNDVSPSTGTGEVIVEFIVP